MRPRKSSWLLSQQIPHLVQMIFAGFFPGKHNANYATGESCISSLQEE